MIKVEILKPVNNGYNIAYHDNKTCFVRGAIEGEIVLCNITLEKKNYRFCNTFEVVKKSKKRIPPVCKVYNKCGGCNYQHIDYNEQIKIKEIIANEIFAPYNIDIFFHSENSLRYRNKAMLPFSKGKIGFYKEKSNTIIEFPDCFLQSKKVNKLINILKKELKTDKNLLSIITRNNYNNEILLCLVIGNGEKNYSTQLKKLTKKYPKLIDTAWISIKKTGNKNYLLNGKNKCIVAKNNPYLKQKIGNTSYFVGPTTFFQVNNEITTSLYNKICEEITNEYDNIIDAYCGIGTIGIYANKDFIKNIIFIEDFPESIKLLKKNIKLNNIRNSQVIFDKFENVTSQIDFNEKSILIVDPPRAGLKKNIAEIISKQKLNKLIYVSCNPSTLKRDIDKLSETFFVEKIFIFDMFPQTYHFETLAVLKRK